MQRLTFVNSDRVARVFQIHAGLLLLHGIACFELGSSLGYPLCYLSPSATGMSCLKLRSSNCNAMLPHILGT